MGGGPNEMPAIGRLRARVAKLLNWPEESVLPTNGGPFHVARYPPKGHLACHHTSDNILFGNTLVAEDGRGPSRAPAWTSSSETVRAITVEVFLNDVVEGG